MASEKWEAHSGIDYSVVMRDDESTDNASIQVMSEDREALSKLIADLLNADPAPAPSPGVTSEPARDYDFHGNPPDLPACPELDIDEGGRCGK